MLIKQFSVYLLPHFWFADNHAAKRIKENKEKKETDNRDWVLFQPTFGNRPEQYIGRDGVIEQFMEGLQEPIGSRNRYTLLGMVKTTLLLDLSDEQTAGHKTLVVVYRQ